MSDKQLYTITEWKLAFGEPGRHVDAQGRDFGTFATDPDYLDEPMFTKRRIDDMAEAA
jgi:hypothetical protein